MKKGWVLTQEAFEALLDWLDEDPDQAAIEYERIRRKLIRIFAGRGCPVADEVTDETFNRVTVKIHELAAYEGDKILYFYAVGNNVYREWIKEHRRMDSEPLTFVAVIPSDPNEDEKRYQCLERCWEELPEDSRSLFLEYNRDDKRAKIEHRKTLADQYGTINALRIKAHRIRLQLKQCITRCLDEMPAH